MAKFSQVELMNAHKAARNNATKVQATDPGVDTEVASKPTQFEDTEHPFTGNDNNRRVAERIARQRGMTTNQRVVTSPQEAAKADLAKADAYEAENPDEFAEDDEDAQNASSIAEIAAGLNGGSPTVLQPLTPAQKAAQTRKAKLDADAAAMAAAQAPATGAVDPTTGLPIPAPPAPPQFPG